MSFLPILPDISVNAAGDSPDEKLDSLVRQLNEWGRAITQQASTFKNESQILMNYWFGSYKLTSTYTDIPGSVVEINFNDWEIHNWYWEATLFTDIGTGSARLYNVTDSVAVPSAEFSTTVVGENNAVTERTGILAKYKGTKTFKVQVKIVGGNGTNEYVNCVKSSQVFKIET